MKWLLVGLFLIPPLFLIGTEANQEGTLQTVDDLDVEKYLGKWYAIASIETFFNSSCAWGNRAEYSRREDGRISVKNTCYKENGEKREVSAAAWVPDGSEPGRLKVSFIPFLNYRLFPADYLVIELGENYEYAVVGHPSRSLGWILSRQPTMEEEKLNRIAENLEAVGYNYSDFKINKQKSSHKDI